MSKIKITILVTFVILGSLTSQKPASAADFALPEFPAPPIQTPRVTVSDFTFTYNGQNFTAPTQTMASWKGTSVLSKNNLKRPKMTVQEITGRFLGRQPADNKLAYYRFRADKIFAYVKSLTDKINTPVQEPTLTIQDGRALDFTPPRDGRAIDLYQTTLDALAALEQSQNSVALTVNETKPQASLTELNNLGISELIGEGVSNFSGSPQNRRHNIAVGVEKFKGVIIQRGEEFSFNKYLGPVDGEHGFKPELVIKKTGTVPEFGGGLCQVSSTTFRAAMNAGLPITQRKNHAYAVQYYSPQGTDATIYPGVVDLKFINDTPGAVLVWPYIKDKNTLVFDFYGTKDNRQITLEKPVQWDRKTDGSMKASWTRIVVKDGETSTSTFKSIYLPPALFHKTEEFVKPTTTPAVANRQ